MALDVANLDRTCKPCDDFHQFAVGGWLKTNPIPAQYPVWGSFITLADKNKRHCAASWKRGSEQVGQRWLERAENRGFLRSCMDTKEIDAQGLKPIAAELAAIEPFVNGGLLDTAARLANARCGCAFHFWLRPGF